jgi:alpha-tubulin suppressor-like RCC1 family protein
VSVARFPGLGDEFGRFRIHGVLGRGGMGMVFDALDPQLDRSVALKVLLPSYSDDDGFRERFRSEAAVLARLDSPHVVQIYEYGEIDGCLFIATQLVRGTDLERHLFQHGPLDPDTAVDVVGQLCEGLDDAHRVGVVHRDIKPSNVLLHERAGGLYVHLCDFGIALTDTGTRTRSGVLVGSVPYLAPECHEGERADARSDVYAVGCLLFHALTGRPPFEGTDVQVAMAHLRDPVPPLTAPGTAHLDPVVQKATAKDPVDRFQSAAEMMEALLTADPDAPPVPARQRAATRARTRKLVPDQPSHGRRSPRALVAAAALALVAAVAAFFVVMQLRDDGAEGQFQAVRLTGGSAQTCAVTRDTRAWCWGWNNRGQLGDGTTERRVSPEQVEDEGWTTLSTGFEQTCGVKEDGTAWCWGAGSGEPDQLPGDGWESVVVRQLHACGLRDDGTIWCWGENKEGQLGDGTTRPYAAPHQVLGDDWTDVAVGQFHTCGIKADTTLWCWGGNEFGQLGNGTGEPSLTPVQVPGQGWLSLTTRSGHTCGVKADGSAWCWGRNEVGQLGDGTTTPRRTPVQVPGSGWRELRTGGNFTCGLRENRTVWCWGGNEYGQLGDGTLTARSEPTRLPGTVWERFAMGHSHVCATKSDDSVWCWGRNHEGQLGNGTTTGSRAPVPVVLDS